MHYLSIWILYYKPESITVNCSKYIIFQRNSVKLKVVITWKFLQWSLCKKIIYVLITSSRFTNKLIAFILASHTMSNIFAFIIFCSTFSDNFPILLP